MESETASSEQASELNEISAYDEAGTERTVTNGVSASSFTKQDSGWNQCSPSESASQPQSNPKQEDSKSSKRFGEDDLERRYKFCLRAEIVGLCVLIVIVWGLLSLPIVFYHLPVELNQTAPTSLPAPVGSGMPSCDDSMTHKYTSVCGSRGTQRQSVTCAVPTTYTESVCQKELNSLKVCLLDSDVESSHPFVATDSEQENAELALSAVVRFASGPCAKEVKPFLCLYFFGLCDSETGALYQPTASQCRNLRDDVCKTEWSLALQFGLSLPDCDAVFSDQALQCNGEDVNATEMASGSGIPASTTALPLPPMQPQTLSCSNITCREGFYCPEGANVVCTPSCHSWRQYPHSTNVAIDFLVILSACIGVITGVGVLTIAGLRWKKVLVFPSSLAVYQTITLLVLAFFVIVNYTDNSTLYCTSENLYQSLQESTAFCVITGIIFYYCLLQLAAFWLCHVLLLFWKVKFPFHSRAFQMSNRIKYIHVTCIVIGIVLPVIPVVATMSQHAHGKSTAEAAMEGLGFGITRFPPLLCTGRHGDTTFYSLVLPILAILMIGIPILITVFWIIHRQHGLFKARQSKNPYKVGTAERKILIVFVYYIILAVIALLAFSLTIRDEKRFTYEVFQYFQCESKGFDPSNPCDNSGYLDVLHVGLTSLSYVLLGIFPSVNFIFVINVQELKQYIKGRFPFVFRRSKRKAAKFVSDTPSASTSSTTGMLAT